MRNINSVSWKAVIASAIHAIVAQTARILPSFSTPIYEVGDTGAEDSVFIIVLIITFVASVVLYLYTGIPFSIFTKKCGECGETNNAGEAWCDNCGTVHGVEAFGLQAAWVITGYTTISTLSLYLLWETFIRNFELESLLYLTGFNIIADYIIIAFMWSFVLVISANISLYISIFRHDTN